MMTDAQFKLQMAARALSSYITLDEGLPSDVVRSVTADRPFLAKLMANLHAAIKAVDEEEDRGFAHLAAKLMEDQIHHEQQKRKQ